VYIKLRKQKWTGHALRKDHSAIGEQILVWNPHVQRRKGRPRRSWRRTTEEDTEIVGKTLREVKPVTGKKKLNVFDSR
jgi:hypothetical protein